MYQFKMLERVSVYRDASGSDCTNNGASSFYNDFKLIWREPVPVTRIEIQREKEEVLEDIVTFFAESEYHSLDVVLERNALVVSFSDIFYVVPLTALDTGKSFMYGGNLLSTSDSRFSQFGAALKIHDRTESKDHGGA